MSEVSFRTHRICIEKYVETDFSQKKLLALKWRQLRGSKEEENKPKK